VQQAACPSCGAPIRFRSTALPVVVCDFCRSSVLRRDDGLTLAGVSARVPDALTPLQLGTTGRYEDRGFELIGRVAWQWRDDAGLVGGQWTEWQALFADGSTGWLAEAMGRHAMFRALEPLPSHPIVAGLRAGDSIDPGAMVIIADIGFRIRDARAACAIGSDGELPFAAPAGETMFNIDLASADGHVASLQKHGRDVTGWIGRAVALQALQPKKLRRLDGWQAPDWAA
jgi:hypothetical protein